MESVMDMAQGFFGGETLSRVSAWLHESPSATKKAVLDALPVSLMGLANQASSEEGSRALLGRFQSGDYPHIDADELGRTVRDPAAAERMVDSNRGATEGMFGGKLEPLVAGMSDHAGVSRSAISKVLAMAAPIVLGMIGKRAVSEKLDAGGLRNLLGEQQQIASKSLPSSLSRLLAPAGGMAAATIGHRATGAPLREVPEHVRKRATPWWIVLLFVAAAIAIWARAHRRRQQTPARTAVSQPAGPEQIAAGNVGALDRALSGNTPLPQQFVVQGLNFIQDSAEIAPGTARVLDDIAGSLRAHPNAKIRLEGYTDATGAPDANRTLSQSRAEASKRFLTEHGIEANRIDAAGFGAARPIASNDTPEGRAENRRTEVVVLAR